MNRYGYGTRLLSLMLAMIMVFSMIPALAKDAHSAISFSSKTLYASTDYEKLDLNKKITMPIKVMDYESDGMLFEYLFSQGLSSHSAYKPETIYWEDFTGTLSGTKANSYSYVTHGSGMDVVSLAPEKDNDEYKWDSDIDNDTAKELWCTVSKNTLGGKRMITVYNNKTNGVPLQWQIADFTSDVTASQVRYAVIVFRAYLAGSLKDPKISISKKLSEDVTKRNATGNFSGYYHLNTGSSLGATGTMNAAGDRHVDVAVIDLSSIKGSFEKLYLEFPMDPSKANATSNNTAENKFDLIAVGFFPNEADAHEFGYWGATLGCTSNTNSQGDTDSYSGNRNAGYSFWHNSGGSFGSVSSLTRWANKTRSYGKGELPLYLIEYDGNTTNLATGYGTAYDDSSISMKFSEAMGYTLYETFGDPYAESMGVFGLLESGLDESGVPVYKQAVVDYVAAYTKNLLTNWHSHDIDGWRNMSAVNGQPNGEIFGYTTGGQVDHDPNQAGVQGIPMDFATAICEHMGLKRRAYDAYVSSNSQQLAKYPGATYGAYKDTLAKKEFLEGEWLICKQYITSWYDLAYYMLHNLWIPNSYNELQSDYNYLELYYNQKTGNYIFDSAYTNGSSVSTVQYNKNNKTIGLSGSSYMSYNTFDSIYSPSGWKKESAYNSFHPLSGESSYASLIDTTSSTYKNKNFGYTFVCNGMFTYKAGQKFRFDGDDDVYLFINGELVMDLGGTHSITTATISLDNYVNWAKKVLAAPSSYSKSDVARAEKLNLVQGQNYTFDFYYAERKTDAANLRVETNIEIFVPPLDVEKKSYQDGELIPDNGVADNSRPVEYGFTLHNSNETSKLYKLHFKDTKIGVTLDPTNGLRVTGDNVMDKNGDTLDVTDLVAEIDGYTGNPRRPQTKKLDTITVTFKTQQELINFLTNLSSSKTETGQTDGLYSGDGLWCYASVTIRGIYYKQTADEQQNTSFVNTVAVDAYNGEYKLSGEDKHILFKFGEPCYFQWRDKKIVVSREKLYEDLLETPTYNNEDIPDYGCMKLTLCNSSGQYMEYEYVNSDPGGDLYFEIDYDSPGLKFFYLRVDDRCHAKDPFVVTVAVYVLDVSDAAIVLDYGLTANLTQSGGIISNEDNIEIAGKSVLNEVIGITGVGGTAEYKEMSSKDLEALYSQTTKHNESTMVDGYKLGGYVGTLEHPIHLMHDVPWVIEFKSKNAGGGLLFANEVGATNPGNTFLHINVSKGFIALGERKGNSYLNYAVTVDTSILMDTSTYHTYRLVNELAADGSNMVYLYIDSTKIGALDDYRVGAGDVTAQDTSFVSGRDFTFNCIGADGNGTDLTICVDRYEYIRVWEEGLELQNYRWQTINGELKAVNINESGNVLNSISTYSTSKAAHNRDVVLNADGTLKEVLTGTKSNGKYYKMNQSVMLSHLKEWAIEFKYSGLDANPNDITQSEEIMIFSSQGTSDTSGHQYLYLRADNGMVALGSKGVDDTFNNYGLLLKELIPGFNTSVEHTYRLENRVVNIDTHTHTYQCMVYLFVDGEEIGPMNQYYQTDRLQDEGNTYPAEQFFSTTNFNFTHIGCDMVQWTIEGTLHYLQVWEDTKLRGSYGWDYDGTNFDDMHAEMPDGNRLNFVENDKLTFDDGEFYLENKSLFFQPTDIMDEEYTIKIAFSIFETNGKASALNAPVDICNEVQMFKNITVVPANVVYYEDDFPAIKYDASGKNSFTSIGSSGDLVQAPEQDTPYGSDSVYNDTLENMTGDSLHVLTIKELGPISHFEFTGSGFEIVARTNAYDSGILFVEVFAKDEVIGSDGQIKYDSDGFVLKADSSDVAESVSFVPVITGYDNNNNGGAEEVYAVPLISVKDLVHGEYVVVITGVPSYQYGEDGNVSTDSNGNEIVIPVKLYLDGIRIFHTLTTEDEEKYYTDIESAATFDEIRNMIFNEEAAAAEWADTWQNAEGQQTNDLAISAGLTTWTENPIGKDTFGKVLTGQNVNALNDYLRLGPNNEVYMDGTFTNSALVMLVKDSVGDGHTLQIAMRAMDYGVFMGAGHTYEKATVMISYNNDNKAEWKELVTISSAAEQYYNIPYADCPMIGDYYMVALKVVPVYADVPAMISFSSVKYKNMTFGTVRDQLTSGTGGNDVEEVSNDIIEVLSSTRVYRPNESAPGQSFGNDYASTDEKSLIPMYPTLSFEDEIRYNIYFEVQNLASFNTVDMGLITFNSKLIDGTIEDAVDVIPGATFNGSEYMVHTNGIPAKKMGDTVYFKIYARLVDGSYTYSDVFGYSAAKYANDCLRGDYSDELKSLMIAMLNYGTAAQEYFGYKTHYLLNTGLSAAQQDMVSTFDASMVKSLGVVDAAKAQNFVMSEGSYSAVYPSVSFDGAFALNFYFKPANVVDNGMTFYYWTEEAYNAANVLTLSNASGKSKMTANGDEYGAVIDGIAAKDMSDIFYVVGVYESNGVTYYTNVIPYSLGTYCAQIAGNASSDAQALAAATAVYGYYAEAYFAE